MFWIVHKKKGEGKDDPQGRCGPWAMANPKGTRTKSKASKTPAPIPRGINPDGGLPRRWQAKGPGTQARGAYGAVLSMHDNINL